MTSRRRFLQTGLIGAACACVGGGWAFAQSPPRQTSPTGKWICPPCGCAADGKEFDAPGACPAENCGMLLIPKPADAGPQPPRALPQGAGAFLVPGGAGHETRSVAVHYYRPKTFTPASPILLVIPGAGRNADTYRDGWIAASEAKGVLVAALGYREADYDFAAYQMGGVIKNLQIRNAPRGPDGRPPASLHIADEDISFEVNNRPEQWLFNDFDRIFDLVAAAAGSAQTQYDLFGHSAGGQILHRLVLFRPRSKARRIIAANSGIYTLPDLDVAQPIGLKGAGLTRASLTQSFAAPLTLLLGGDDNDGEAGGLQLHTPLLDRQGADRLSRGRYFFRAAQDQARALGVPFNWTLQVVSDVGHDYHGIGRAAAQILYA